MQVFFLPSVSLPRHLPPRSGIYYVTAAWVIFYVGKSANLRRRWRSHHKQAEFEALRPFGRIHYHLLPTDRLQAQESKEIKRLQPPWNNKTLAPGERLWLKITTGIRMACLTALGGLMLIATVQWLVR
ncbi:MAG: GIY-YIG nuclease family protein [Cyanobacteria bacterium KgW148]|nr:GIY-YIG nuclease family protein [Cyanobacteria bacterium KgW148]